MQLHPEAATPMEGSTVPWTSGGETLSGHVDESVYYVSLMCDTKVVISNLLLHHAERALTQFLTKQLQCQATNWPRSDKSMVV